jgi:aryl-alcohol dehydrogenase-like predicted oxidoreductase
VLPAAARHGMGILTYSPLAGGWLSGRWNADAIPTSPARQRLVVRFDNVAAREPAQARVHAGARQGRQRRRLSLIELAIAFVVNHPR